MSGCASVEKQTPATTNSDLETSLGPDSLDRVLGKGDRAPFSGVLVSAEQYRFYQTQDFRAETLSKHLKDDYYLREPTCEDSWFSAHNGLFFMFGLGLGFVGFALASGLFDGKRDLSFLVQNGVLFVF